MKDVKVESQGNNAADVASDSQVEDLRPSDDQEDEIRGGATRNGNLQITQF